MQVISTERVPIKMWLDDIEDGALDQAKNLANLPFTFKHVAIMPDCLSDDTEVLSLGGWKKITELTLYDKVANYLLNGRILFTKPKSIIIRKQKQNEKIFSFDFVGLNKRIIMSGSHRTSYVKDMGCLAENLDIVTELKDFCWGGNGTKKDIEHKITDEMLCLIAWIVGDGNFKHSNKKKDGSYSSITIRFGFRKDRKVDRVESILKSLSLKYYRKTTARGDMVLSISTKDSGNIIDQYFSLGKQYPFFLATSLSKRQAILFLDEAIQVDGDYRHHVNSGNYIFSSTRQTDIDFLSALISINCGFSNDTLRREGKLHNLKYHQHLSDGTGNGFHRSKVVKTVINYGGRLVCITCNTGFFIARQNGLTFVSGNSHRGYGMPIGGVLATTNVVIPNAVGVDIGCGMCAVRTDHKILAQRVLKDIMSGIRLEIPLGFNHHKKSQIDMWDRFQLVPLIPVILNNLDSATKQLGTLGGGNHFIEIQKGSDGFIWIMIHSGSRNFGLKIAQAYNKLAQKYCKMWYSNIPDFKGQDGLAFFPLESSHAEEYMTAMNFALDFAQANRKLMMDRITEIIYRMIGGEFDEPIDVHHNYARLENHYGKNVMVHRKGATSAMLGQMGIIPGSQGASSFIVIGKGNPQSFNSCSHGAGRRMGRNQARRELNLANEIEKLDAQGIIHSIRHEKDLDEASGAYKDIAQVMMDQKDLVDIKVELKPLAVIKA